MPTPKRKTSKARRDKRQANKHIRPQAVTKCLNCAEPLNPHAACTGCGFYKGVKVMSTKTDRLVKRAQTAQVKAAKQAKAQPQQAAPEPSEDK